MSASHAAKTFSVVIPCYNEGDIIGKMIEKTVSICDAYIADTMHTYEVVVVDDGSTDKSAETIKQAAKKYQNVHALCCQENRGKGAVIAEGLQRATGAYKMFIDGDLEINPQYIVTFFDVLQDNAEIDIAIGSKYCAKSKVDVSWKRKVFSSVYRLMNRVLFGLSVEDTQVGVKAMRATVVAIVIKEMRTTGYAFDIELLVRGLRHGFVVKEIPVDVVIDAAQSRITRSAIIRMMRDTLATYRSFFHRDMGAMLHLEYVRLRPFSVRHFAVYPLAVVGSWSARLILVVIGLILVCGALYKRQK